MVTKRQWIVIGSLVFMMGMAGCGASAPETSAPASPSETPNVQATIDAAVAATASAQAEVEQAINEGVAATLTALPPQVTPTPVAVDELSQAEMADAVNASADEAEAASEQCSAAVDSATADGVVTAEEVVYMTYYAAYAEDEIQQAYDLAEEYLDLYAELAEESIAILEDIEDDLDEMAANTAAVSQTLEEMNAALEQGQEVAADALEQLNTQADTIQAKTDEIKAKTESWSGNVKTEIDSLDQLLANMQPNESADSLRSALQMAKDYADTIKVSMGDGKFSRTELESIAQKGANASAGLQQFGGADLQNLAGSIGGMTGEFARGELPQAKMSFSSFEMSLPSIPSR